MEIKQLKTFKIVAEDLNLTKASMRLNYSQSTITKHIQMLENEIGTPLFHNKGSKKELTKAGEILYKHANKVLNEMYNLNNELEYLHNDIEVIRICGPDLYCYKYFVPQIQKCLNRNPNVSIEILATSSDDCVNKVLQHEAEFGIVVGKQIPSELAHYCIDYEDLVLYASSKTAKKSAQTEYLTSRYPVLIDQKSNYIYYGFLKQGLKFPKMIYCNSDEALKNGVLNHPFLGIQGTGRLKDEIESGEITILETYSSNVPVHLIALKSNLNNPTLRTFFNSFQNRLHIKQ